MTRKPKSKNKSKSLKVANESGDDEASGLHDAAVPPSTLPKTKKKTKSVTSIYSAESGDDEASGFDDDDAAAPPSTLPKSKKKTKSVTSIDSAESGEDEDSGLENAAAPPSTRPKPTKKTKSSNSNLKSVLPDADKDQTEGLKPFSSEMRQKKFELLKKLVLSGETPSAAATKAKMDYKTAKRNEANGFKRVVSLNLGEVMNEDQKAQL